MTLTISLYASYHTCLSFLQPLPLSVFQTTTVCLSNCSYQCLSFKLPLSLYQATTVSPSTTSVSLSMSLTISLYASHHTCLSFLQPLPLSLFQTTTVSLSNYHCLSLKLPLSLFQTTSVSLSNYHCLSIRLPLSLLQLLLSLYQCRWQSLFMLHTIHVSLSHNPYLCLSFKLPLFLYLTTFVSLSNYLCLSI